MRSPNFTFKAPVRSHRFQAPDFATFIKGLVSGEEFEAGEDV